MAKIAVLENWVQGDLRPDLTLLLDLPITVGLARAGKRGAADRFERETVDFFERVRMTYLDLARQVPERYRIIDAARSVERVRVEVKSVLAQCLERG